MPGEEIAEWRFIHRDKGHISTWRLVHLPTGWRSPPASRWKREDAGVYTCGLGDFGYRIEFTPDGEEAAKVYPETRGALKRMAGQSSFEYNGDGNTVDEIDWFLHPEAEPTRQEVREAYLDGRLTDEELEEALENVDLEPLWEPDEDGALAELSLAVERD